MNPEEKKAIMVLKLYYKKKIIEEMGNDESSLILDYSRKLHLLNQMEIFDLK